MPFAGILKGQEATLEETMTFFQENLIGHEFFEKSDSQKLYLKDNRYLIGEDGDGGYCHCDLKLVKSIFIESDLIYFISDENFVTYAYSNAWVRCQSPGAADTNKHLFKLLDFPLIEYEF